MSKKDMKPTRSFRGFFHRDKEETGQGAEREEDAMGWKPGSVADNIPIFTKGSTRSLQKDSDSFPEMEVSPVGYGAEEEFCMDASEEFSAGQEASGRTAWQAKGGGAQEDLSGEQSSRPRNDHGEPEVVRHFEAGETTDIDLEPDRQAEAEFGEDEEIKRESQPAQEEESGFQRELEVPGREGDANPAFEPGEQAEPEFSRERDSGNPEDQPSKTPASDREDSLEPPQSEDPGPDGQEPKAFPGEGETIPEEPEAHREESLSWEKNFQAVEERVGELHTMLEAISLQLGQDVAKALRNEELTKSMYSELQEYKKDLYGSITLPFIREFISLRQNMVLQCKPLLAEQGPGASISVEDVLSYAEDIQEALRTFDVETIHSDEGEPVNIRMQKILKREKTQDPEKDKTVAHSMTDGYIYRGKVIEKESVIAYVYEEKAEEKDKDE